MCVCVCVCVYLSKAQGVQKGQVGNFVVLQEFYKSISNNESVCCVLYTHAGFHSC